MFETIIASFIKRYVTRYIDINADQLSAQLLYKQQITIDNLTVNQATLNDDIRCKLKLPLQIESIDIGRIQCSFVWSSLFFRSSSAACIIKIEHIHIVIKDNNEHEALTETNDDNEHIRKRHQLDLAEQQLEKELECFGEVKSSRWNVQRLFMSFLEKLQIEIVDVHISYQSALHETIGLTCSSIQISNEPSNECMSRQVFRIDKPGIYIDMNNSSAHAYILSLQSSMEISVKHNHFQISQPEYHYELECLLNDFDIRCNVEQVRILVDIIRYIRYSSLYRMLIYDPSRPQSKISQQSVKAWWRYATLAILQTQMDSKNLTTHFWFDRSLLFHRLHRLSTYKCLYRAYLDDKDCSTSNFSSQDAAAMKEIETELNLEHLLIIRRSIFQSRINEQNSRKQETTRWYSNYANWITSKVIDLWGSVPETEETLTTTNVDQSLHENDVKIQEQVNTFIADSIEDEDRLESYHDARIFRFNFVLKSIQIDLLSSSNISLFKFYLRNLFLITEFRLRQRSIMASIRLDDLLMRDQGEIEAFSTVISSKGRTQSNMSPEIPVLEFTLERKDKSKTSIGIRSCGLCVVCSPASVERLYDFYTAAFGHSSLSFSLSLDNWKRMKNSIVRNCISVSEEIMPAYSIKNQRVTTTSLQNTRRNRRRGKRKFHVYVDMGAPKMIIPRPSHDALVVDLGRLILTNETSNKSDTATVLSNAVFTQPRFDEHDDDDEFLTPVSSPPANDHPDEEESIYYSINILPTDQSNDPVAYSSFTLSVHDIQVGYSVDLSQIVEKFSIDFRVQHLPSQLWPLMDISGTLQKIVLHADLPKSQSLSKLINPWITFINKVSGKQYQSKNVWPELHFHLEEVNILVNDHSDVLCDLRMPNIDLSLVTNNRSKKLSFSLQSLTILDCMQKVEQDYEVLLKTNQTSNENSAFVRATLDFLAGLETPEISFTTDVNADKLDFVCNPRTICTLVNLLSDIDLFSWHWNTFRSNNIGRNPIRCEISAQLRELNIVFMHITPMVLSTEVHGWNVILNILFHSDTRCEMTIDTMKVFNHSQQSTTAMITDLTNHLSNNEVLQNTALRFLLINKKDDDSNLSVEIASFSYFYSPAMIYAMQQTFDYITQNCHLIAQQESSKENSIIWLRAKTLLSTSRWTLCIDLKTSKMIFPMNIGLEFDHIRIRNNQDQSSDCAINIDRIDLLLINFTAETKMKYNNRSAHLSWPFLENISISCNLHLFDASIKIDFKLISPLRIYLSQHRINFLQQIFSTIFVQNTTPSLFKFAFHIQSSQMMIIFQTDRNYQLITICQGLLNQCQMVYALDYPDRKKITVQFDSFQMKDDSKNSGGFLIALQSPSFIQLSIPQSNDEERQLDVKLGKIIIEFVRVTWMILSEMIDIFRRESYSSTNLHSEAKKKPSILFSSHRPVKVSIDVDSISCLFQENKALLMHINLQRFTCQVQTYLNDSILSWIVTGQLGSISIRDLTIIDQLYSERLRTNAGNVIDFIFTNEQNNVVTRSVRPQFYLRITSIQYIHTHRFLLRILAFWNHFRENEEFYHRLQSLVFTPVVSNMSRQLNGILLNIEIEDLTLMLPEHIQKTPVLVFQLGSINIKNHFLFQNKPNVTLNQSQKHNTKSSRLDYISIEIKDLIICSASHSSINQVTSPSIHFSNDDFQQMHHNRSSIVRERFHIHIEIEHNLDRTANPTSPTYTMKMSISSLDILLDRNQYHLIENIITHNVNEQSTMISSNLFDFITTSKENIYTDFTFTIEIDRVGLELFLRDIDLLSLEHRRSFVYTALTNFHLSFDQYSNGDQVLHLLGSTIKLIDTRTQDHDMIVPLAMPSKSNQLEVYLNKTRLNNQCTISFDAIRLLVVIDWLLDVNEFFRSLCEQQTIMTTTKFSNISFEMKLNFNRFELVLVPTIQDPYASALIYSSTMILIYHQQAIRSLQCSISDLTFFTCQIGNIDGTAVPFVEPTDCSLKISTSNEIIDEQICELDLPIFNIRVAYSDIKMLYSLFHTITQQISQAKTRKPLLTSISTILTAPIRDHPSSTYRFLDIKFFKLLSNQICLCLIDNCFAVNIPLFNLNLHSFNFQTIENNRSNRLDQSEFQLNISYYNRFQSGFEPLIEPCILQMILTRSSSTTSLLISSKEILNLNLTKAMYRLYTIVKRNWSTENENSKKKIGFRHVKPLEPYCLKNSIGVRMKFRTWMPVKQIFSSHEHIVNDNQTISFSFAPENTNAHSATRTRKNSIVTSLLQTDRRLLISIDGWECLQPISIDRIGTFFRTAVPSGNHQLYKPILVMIDIAMTDTSIRSITIRSSIEIRNQLLTAIDIQLESRLDSFDDIRLESNEMYSLPIRLCSILRQVRIRPADFALDYCDEPISWIEIDNESDALDAKSSDENAIHRQSFLRSCSIDRKEAAVYYLCLQSKQTGLLTYRDQTLSLYQLSIHSPLTICNLLPCSLTVETSPYSQKTELNAYQLHREHALNILQNIDILLTMNRYRMNKSLRLPAINDLHEKKHTHQRVIFYDSDQRELFVDITLVCVIKYRVKLLVSVPYVLLNKSGIPLIFKDANSKVEAAGQNADDELMLNREPLLFASDNASRNNTCVMRVGTGLHHHQDGHPQWSQRFNLEHGSTHRQLQVRSSRKSSDWTYSIAIDIRPGNGYLKKRTNFIFLSARYMIYNQCSYDLLIAQQQVTHDEASCLYVLKHATVAYHWSRADVEQLLCVQVMEDGKYQSVNWSGGFSIDTVNAFHINIRYANEQCLILRVQVIERDGTYFVVFMDSNKMPAPFRLCNRSNIPIQFYQAELSHLRTVVPPHQSIDYALDEPTLKPKVTCSVADGPKTTYDLLKLGNGDNLHYQNYIHLALQATFEEKDLMSTLCTTDDFFESLSHRLVIEYHDNRLFLARHQENKRSQLWHMTDNGLLIHIGSLTNQDSTGKKDLFDDMRQVSVLDIQDSSDSDLHSLIACFSPLTVRRYDPKRIPTQTWQFTDSGYLCLQNTTLCVQIFGELKKNSDVVLGPTIKNKNPLPSATMHIRSYQCHKGSGILYVRTIADGPTNVLEIDDLKPTNLLNRTVVLPSIIYQLDLHFTAGVGISVVNSINQESEELIYVLVNNVHIEYNSKDNNQQSIDATIDTLVISNQLLASSKPCFLYATFTDGTSPQSAIRFHINWEKCDTRCSLLHIIHSLRIDITSISIQLDELLLWKLVDFFDIESSSLSSLLFKAVHKSKPTNSDRQIDSNVNEYETERILSLMASTHASRVYFNQLCLSSLDLNLSVYCIHSKRSLSPHLLAIKRQASFPLVPFENARIHLKSYEQTHIFNTPDFFLLSLKTHYVNVGKRQAMKILGTVDFLGNPLGLLHDVSDGFACLGDQRGVSGLVKNVAHGVADSTSKVVGSIAQGLGKLVSDNERTSRRQAMAENHKSSSFEQAMRHGRANLAAGFHNGLTSIIKQPYKDSAQEGMPGFVKSFAKGIVGTVSKPVVGILDFTNDMATAVKEVVRSTDVISHTRIRPTRCPSNIFGLLQCYSVFDAHGHYLLYKMNKGNATERYISRLTISTIPINTSDKQILATNSQRNKDTWDQKVGYIVAMITSKRVIIYRTDDDPDLSNNEIIDSYDFTTTTSAVPIEHDDGSASVQFLLDSKTSTRSTSTSHRCDTLEQAILVSRDIQHAQDILHDDQMITIPVENDNDDHDNDFLDDQFTE